MRHRGVFLGSPKRPSEKEPESYELLQERAVEKGKSHQLRMVCITAFHNNLIRIQECTIRLGIIAWNNQGYRRRRGI